MTDSMVSLPPFLSFAMDGQGGGVGSTSPNVDVGPAAFTWIHLWHDAPSTSRWLNENGIDPTAVAALMAEETRPRCTPIGEGVVMSLRGVNLNPGAEADDMVSIRLWLEERRIVTVWVRPLRAISDIKSAISRDQGPVDTGDFVAKLALRLASRAEPTIATLNDQLDSLEDADTSDWMTVNTDLKKTRLAATSLRRFMFPQRDALSALAIEDLPWLSKARRARLGEATDRVTRLAEELDVIRDRAQVVHEALMAVRAERMNRQMLILSVAASIFLPLSLIAGLLGMNVGGVPGQESALGFWITCGLVLAVALGQLWYLRRSGLLK